MVKRFFFIIFSLLLSVNTAYFNVHDDARQFFLNVLYHSNFQEWLSEDVRQRCDKYIFASNLDKTKNELAYLFYPATNSVGDEMHIDKNASGDLKKTKQFGGDNWEEQWKDLREEANMSMENQEEEMIIEKESAEVNERGKEASKLHEELRTILDLQTEKINEFNNQLINSVHEKSNEIINLGCYPANVRLLYKKLEWVIGNWNIHKHIKENELG